MTKQDLKELTRLSETIEQLQYLTKGPIEISSKGYKISLDINESDMLSEVQDILQKYLKIKQEKFDNIKLD